MFRLLITGSREWSDVEVIVRELKFFADKGEVTLVSGNCPDGADAIAEEVAIGLGWTLERHPADWKKNGKKAGFVRNAEMVDSGADACVAFILDESAGASNTVVKAKIKKIPTKVIKATTPAPAPTPEWLLAWSQE